MGSSLGAKAESEGLAPAGAVALPSVSESNQMANEASPLFALPYLTFQAQALDSQARERKNAALLCGIRHLIA